MAAADVHEQKKPGRLHAGGLLVVANLLLALRVATCLGRHPADERLTPTTLVGTSSVVAR